LARLTPTDSASIGGVRPAPIGSFGSPIRASELTTTRSQDWASCVAAPMQ
jgi:hypothetical protein